MTIGIGLLGCGRIASAVHLPILARSRGVDLVAVADPHPGGRESARRATGVNVYEDEGALLDDPRVDAVVICTPSADHARMTIAAANAGKHVYVEKPIATTAEDAEQAIAAVQRAGTIGVVGLNRRSHPLFEQGRRLLRAGRIGRVRAVNTVFCEAADIPDWKRRRETGGGVLLDLASHHFDLLRWLLDEEIETVEASLRSDESEHDSAWVRVVLEGGVEAQSFFSFVSGTADIVELVGERGVLRLDRYVPPVLLTRRREGISAVRRVPIAPSGPLLAWRLRRLVRPANEPSYRRSLVSFVRHLQGQAVDLPTLEDGRRSLQAVLAAEESALEAV